MYGTDRSLKRKRGFQPTLTGPGTVLAYAQGISSSMRFIGHRLTSLSALLPAHKGEFEQGYNVNVACWRKLTFAPCYDGASMRRPAHLSASRLVTIAQIEGRVRAAGSEFVLACDMRFAARESAIFSLLKALMESAIQAWRLLHRVDDGSQWASRCQDTPLVDVRNAAVPPNAAGTTVLSITSPNPLRCGLATAGPSISRHSN